MPRKALKRWLPDPHKLRSNSALRLFGALLHDPNLFHLNRHSVSVAFFVGLFIAFLPLPFQVPLAAVAALVFRCNLPIAVALVWISNPLTIPIIFYATYKFGAAILHTPESRVSFQLSIGWFQSEFLLIWQPLIVGSLLASVFFGCSGYVGMQWLWRWHAVKKWEKRKIRRLQAQDKGLR